MNYKILNSSLCMLGFTLMAQAHAACPPSQGFKSVDIPITIGQIVVRPSDPIGKVLAKQSFPINQNGSTYLCDPSGGYLDATLSQNTPLSALGNNIYSTNIYGIGIRLYHEAENSSNFSKYYPYTQTATPNTLNSLNEGYLVVEIIKTATQTGSGALLSGRYSSYAMRGYSTFPWLTSTIYNNSVLISSSSCEIQGNPNKTVQLPSVNKIGFTGVGSTQGEQLFDLNILCNAGNNSAAGKKISLSFDYDAAANTANQVLNNTAPANTKAEGVGTQLILSDKNQERVIAKANSIKLGTLKSNQSTQYNVSMKARYYKTSANVSAGKVQGMATVTIEYD